MLNNWHAKAIDFDKACDQACCDVAIYLYLLDGFQITNKNFHVMELIKNVCVMRQVGHNFCKNSDFSWKNEDASSRQLTHVLFMKRM